MRFHPWRALRHQPEIELGWERMEGEDVGYSTSCPKRIALADDLNQAERRSTLTHELIHHERGIPAEGCNEAEERVVDDLAARRLIALDDLVEAMVWHFGMGSEDEIAEHLWVDRDTLVTRLRNLTDYESAYIANEIDRRELHIP